MTMELGTPMLHTNRPRVRCAVISISDVRTVLQVCPSSLCVCVVKLGITHPDPVVESR